MFFCEMKIAVKVFQLSEVSELQLSGFLFTIFFLCSPTIVNKNYTTMLSLQTVYAFTVVNKRFFFNQLEMLEGNKKFCKGERERGKRKTAGKWKFLADVEGAKSVIKSVC